MFAIEACAEVGCSARGSRHGVAPRVGELRRENLVDVLGGPCKFARQDRFNLLNDLVADCDLVLQESRSDGSQGNTTDMEG